MIMNCNNITVASTLANCTNQTNATINATLESFQNNSQIPTIPPPYTPAESLSRLISYIVILILASLGNIIVIICFFIDRELRSTFNLFILNVTITDLLTASVRMSFDSFLIATIRGWFWPYSWSLCQFSGFMQLFLQTSNIMTLLFMAVFRYIVVVLSKSHLVTSFSVLCTIGLIWMISLLQALLPIFGWNRYTYQVYEFSCLPDWDYEKSFPIFLMVFVFAIPLLVMMFCYVSIYWTVRKNSKRIRGMSESHLSNTTVEKIAGRESKVTLNMFIIFAAFLICIGPYVICMFILFPIFSIWVGKDMAFFCGWMVNFNSVINPMIYPFLNERFKKSYYLLYCRICKREGRHTLKNGSLFTTTKSISVEMAKVVD